MAGLATIATGAAQEQGRLLREVWKDIPGSGTWHLKNSPKYQSAPDFSDLIAGAEVIGEDEVNYGERLRGYLTVPESGEYHFAIAGDDNCELWLGEGESKFRTRKVAWIVGLGWGHERDFSGLRQWDKIPTQRSAGIRLEAGKRYFLEVIHKQGLGAAHVSVGWVRPGTEQTAVIAPEFLAPYGPDPEDVDGDELADAWEESHGLSPRDAGRSAGQTAAGDDGSGPLGDPDGDGLKNWEEQKLGSDPQADTGVAGRLERDLWYGIWGRDIASLLGSRGFYGPPDRRDLVAGASTTTDSGDQCGVRLRGWLTAPQDGDYQFWLAGDDECELLLSTDDSKFHRQRIAFIEGGPGFVRPGEWDKLEGQASAPVRLEAGKKYYFEVLLKEGWWEDFVSVAWRKPGGEREEIPASALTSYAPGTEDRDDDGLPSSWEEAYGLDPADAGGLHGALGDPDGDLIPNIVEYESGSSPVVANGLAGAATVQVWEGLSGVRIEDLVQRPEFLAEPAQQEVHAGGLELGGRGDRYGMRVRAQVTAPAAGDYTFWIAGDNHCELWLAPDATAFRKEKIAWVKGPGSDTSGDWVNPGDWDVQASQRSRPVRLEAGQSYFVEILLKEGVGADHVEVAWQGPGMAARAVVPAAALTSWFRDPADLDDDCLPDEWEAHYGLDPHDNGRVDFARQGERADYDGDGLDNRTEYLLGTDPCHADSDGDGVGDYAEVKVYGSDPTRRDASPPVVVANLPPTGAIGGTQRWAPLEGGMAIALQVRGDTVWEFEVTQAGVYRIDLQGQSRGEASPVPEVPVSLLVDGVRIGRGELSAGPPSSLLSYMTPWLAVGRHEVTLVNQNVRPGVTIVVESLAVLAQTGEDADGNGLPDWLENYYRALNRVTAEGRSATSPACIEGSVRFLEDLSIEEGGVTPQPGLAGQWFANVPLPESGEPLEVAFSYEDGALGERASFEWVETNLLSAAERIYLRPGDALRVTAYDAAAGPAGTSFRVTRSGQQILAGPSGEPQVRRFEQAGRESWTVTATLADGQQRQRTLEIEVAGTELGDGLDVPANRSRLWTPPQLPAGIALQSDENLSLQEVTAGGAAARSFQASFAETRATEGRVLARLPDSGAIVDAATLRGFFLATGTWTGDSTVVATLPDGTRVARIGYIIDGIVPQDLSLWIEMWVPDAVFANGDSWLHLTAADFDENGRAWIEIYKAPGNEVPYICHGVNVYGPGPGQPPESHAPPVE